MQEFWSSLSLYESIGCSFDLGIVTLCPSHFGRREPPLLETLAKTKIKALCLVPAMSAVSQEGPDTSIYPRLHTSVRSQCESDCFTLLWHNIMLLTSRLGLFFPQSYTQVTQECAHSTARPIHNFTCIPFNCISAQCHTWLAWHSPFITLNLMRWKCVFRIFVGKLLQKLLQPLETVLKRSRSIHVSQRV